MAENLSQNFQKAIQLVEQAKEKSLCVFDVDSTIFCMKYRTQAIIRDCVKDPRFCRQFPKHLDFIQTVKVTEKDWSIKEILSRYGFAENEPLVLAIEKIWRKLFFSNQYLHQDRPYPGCAQFVRHIFQLGAKLYYLTARNRDIMLEGTVQSLKKWKFPLDGHQYLIMKEDREMEDADYKVRHLKQLAEQSNTILFFENEPVVLNSAFQALPQLRLFWMNSAHSRREEPPKSALTLSMNYRLANLKPSHHDDLRV